MILYLICFLCFIFFPVLSIFVSLFCYIIDKNRKGIFYSILIGLTLGIISYYFIPPIDYDLFRHHLVVEEFNGLNFKNFFLIAKNIDLEFIPKIYSYFISILGNNDLLQFFIVSLGYTILFYMLYDYRKQSCINNGLFIFITIFIIFGFNALYFISGLYCYIAMIIFSFGIYNEYIKCNNKIVSYILYILVLFIHNSLFFAFAIYLFYKLFKNKLNYKNIFICLLCLFFLNYFVGFLNSIINLEIINKLNETYNHYLIRNDYMKKFYSGIIFFIEISKLLMILICIFLQKEKNKFSGVNGYIILLSICTILMIPKSIVMIRFIMIIQFLGIIPIFDYFSKVNKNKILLLIIIIFLDLIYIGFFYRSFRNENFGGLLDKKLIENVFSIFRK